MCYCHPHKQHTHTWLDFLCLVPCFFWFCHSFFLVFYLVAQFNFVENRCRRRRPFLLLLSSFIWIQLDIILMKQEWEKKLHTFYLKMTKGSFFLSLGNWEFFLLFQKFLHLCVCAANMVMISGLGHTLFLFGWFVNFLFFSKLSIGNWMKKKFF